MDATTPLLDADLTRSDAAVDVLVVEEDVLDPDGELLGAEPSPADAAVDVLVVEDDLKLAPLIQRALERVGLSSVVARTGDEALRSLRVRPSLGAMVLDVMIPHPDGIEVCRQARRDGCEVPILVISARGADDHRARALEAGADDFLAKPFPLLELARAIGAMMSSSTPRPRPAPDGGDHGSSTGESRLPSAR